MGNLESYWFKWGSKGQLMRKYNAVVKDLAKLGDRLVGARYDLRRALRHIDHCHKEIAEMQMNLVRPVFDYVKQNMDVTMDMVPVHDIKAQEFRVAVRISSFRWTKMYQTEKTNFLHEVKRDGSRKLADAIADYLMKEIIKSR